MKLPWSKALMWCKIFEMELASFDGGKQEEIFFMELLEDRDKNNLLNITDLLYLGASDAFSNESW